MSKRTNKILVARKLEKIFEKQGNEVNALRGVNLTVNRGEYIALQGPSGSGKTTLLNILGCLDRPTTGRIIIDGTDVSKMNEKDLAKIRGTKMGFIFQAFNLIPILNALENVELPMEHDKNLSRGEKRTKARGLLKLVGLATREKHQPDELSAGEQQRVAIARALANDPAIILADEPTGNLDSKKGKHIMKLLGDLNTKLGTTIVAVTHDDAMARLTKKIIKLKDGKIRNIKDLKGERKTLDISDELEIPRHIVEKLINGRYDTLEKILKLKDRDMKSIPKLTQKDMNRLRNKIREYKHGV